MEKARAMDPFVGISAYQAEHREVFFGRRKETESLMGLVGGEDFRIGVLLGESGVGKTSLINAGLVPRLESAGLVPIVLSRVETLEKEFESAAMNVGATPSMPDEDFATHVFRTGRSLDGKMVLIVDNVSDILEEEDSKGPYNQLVETARRADVQQNLTLRLLLCIDTENYHLLTGLQRAACVNIPPAGIHKLKRFDRSIAAEVIEQSALASGVYFEAGLSGLMAQDMTSRGPVLPLILQVTLNRAVEKNAVFTRRYLRQGGSSILTLDWLKSRCQKTRYSVAVPLLSESADKREHECGWTVLEELALATGLNEQKAASAIDVLEREGLFQTRKRGAVQQHRLSKRCLIPLIHRLDGAYRAKTAKSVMMIRRRLISGGILRPHETIATIGHNPRSSEESALLAKSRKLNFLGMLLFLAALAGLLFWIQIKAQSGYRIELKGAGPMEHRTIVVRRGLPGYSSLAVYSPSPPLGAVLVDTGIAGASLGPGAFDKIMTDKPSGIWETGSESTPGWYLDILNHLEPVIKGKLIFLGGDVEKGYKLFQKLASDNKNLSRILSFIALAGNGAPPEKALILAGLDSKNRRLESRAIESALGIARENPESVMDVLTSKEVVSRPVCRKSILEGAEYLPAKTALDLVLNILDNLGEDDIPVALSIASRFKTGSPDQAALVFANAAGCSSAKQQALEGLRRMGMTHPRETVRALAGILVSRTTAREDLAAVMAEFASKDYRTAEIEKAVLGLLEDENLQVAEKGAELALRLLEYKSIENIVAKMATVEPDENESNGRRRVLAATILRRYAEENSDVDIDLLRSLAEDDSNAEVRLEAVRALGFIQEQRVFLTRKLSDRDINVRAEAMVGVAAQTDGDKYKTLLFFRRLTKKERLPAKIALPRAVAKLITSNKYWPLAQGEILAATRNRSHSIRVAAVDALATIGHLRPKIAFGVLKERVEDGNSEVRRNTARALGRLVGYGGDKILKELFKLAEDDDHSVAVTALSVLEELLVVRQEPAQEDIASGGFSEETIKEAAFKRLEKNTTDILYKAKGDRKRLAKVTGILAMLPEKHHQEDLETVLAEVLRTVQWNEERRRLLCLSERLKLVKPVLVAVETGSRELKTRALKAARDISIETMAQALMTALQDPDIEVQKVAFRKAMSINIAQHSDLLDLLIKRMEDPSDPFSFKALQVLAKNDFQDRAIKKRIGQTIKTAAYSPYVAIRTAAAGAIAKNPKVYEKILIRLLTDPAVEVRRHAILGYAAWLSKKKSADDLASFLAQSMSYRQLRFAAAAALYMKRTDKDGEDARKTLEAAAQSKNPLISVSARAALAVPEGDAGRFMDLMELLFLL